MCSHRSRRLTLDSRNLWLTNWRRFPLGWRKAGLINRWRCHPLFLQLVAVLRDYRCFGGHPSGLVRSVYCWRFGLNETPWSRLNGVFGGHKIHARRLRKRTI